MNRHQLPPHPWSRRGNTVIDGTGKTIAVVFYPRHSGAIAEAVAETMSEELREGRESVPAQTELDEANRRIMQLENENEQLMDKVSDLRDEIAEMKARAAEPKG